MYKHISYTNTCHTCTHMYMYAYTHLYTYIYYMYRYVCWCVKIWKIYRYRCRCRCRCRWRRRCVCEYKHRYFFQGPSGQWETVHSIWEEIPKLHRTWRLRNENTDVSLIKARSWRCFYWYMVGWLVWNLTPQVPFFWETCSSDHPATAWWNLLHQLAGFAAMRIFFFEPWKMLIIIDHCM